MPKDKAVEEHIAICKCDDRIFPLNFRRQLDVLGDIGLDGWWDWHIKEDFEYMSPRFWQFLGYDPVTKRHHPSEWQSIINKDDLVLAADNLNKHIETRGGHRYSQEVRYRCFDGTEKWLLCRGSVIEWDNEWLPVRMIGTHTDISTMKERETSLNEERQKFKSIFTHSNSGIALVNTDGKFIEVNSKLSQMLGFSQHELQSKTYMDITYPEDLDEDNERVYKLLNGDISFYRMEKRYIKRDGDLIWVSISVSLVRDQNGKPKYFVVEIDDIHEKKMKSRAMAKTIVELKDYLGSRPN